MELELDWPPEISILQLKNYILSNLVKHGDPLRWAITSVTNNPEKNSQRIFIEAVLIIDKGEKQTSMLH